MPQEFGVCDIGCSCGEFAWVINEIPTCCADPNTVRIFLLGAVVGIFRVVGLFACNCAEGHEDGQINSAWVVENAPDDALDVSDVVFAQVWGCVGGERVLCFAAVLSGLRLVGAILRFGGRGMPLF